MKNILESSWIKSEKQDKDAAVIFFRDFHVNEKVEHAQLQITSFGVYEAQINGRKVGNYIFAPGWTNYKERLQYQTYDIKTLISKHNNIEISVGRGWRMHEEYDDSLEFSLGATALLAVIEIVYKSGEKQIIYTDENWQVRQSKLKYSNMYNGDVYDATFEDKNPRPAVKFDYPKNILIPQQGERIKEIEKIPALRMVITPNGETCIDFGQNITGYVEFNICGQKGEEVVLYHAEILDKEGNFYTDNLRSAKQEVRFICDGERHVYKPIHSFQGFRYIKLENWSDEILLDDFKAIVVHSNIRRTGYFKCSNKLVNKLYKNILWSQKGNFLDVPTDCPQRDERLGWTGDAQVFARTASYNFGVNKFFEKWLADLKSEQCANGSVPHVVPKLPWDGDGSSGWGDCAVICPWQMYLTYENKELLSNQFDSMRKWVDYIYEQSENYIWAKGKHFGDWLSLDEKDEKGNNATPDEVISTAYFAYSTSLLIKAGKVLSLDIEKYEALLSNVKKSYINKFLDNNGRVVCNTQTGCVLTIYFDLSNNKQVVADQLNELINECGHLKTGFLGTPYLLHTLSENGYEKTAYDLLLREEYPSWLYPVTQGATTVWEHWDGMRPDGTMWSDSMNSFNHYAYGAVADWLYGVMCGINIDENAPGFKHIIFRPVTDERINFARGCIVSNYGAVKSSWSREDGVVKYFFTVPEGCTATIYIDGKTKIIQSGEYEF